MAASRKPQPPDEPTVKDARALKPPAEKSVGRGRKLSGEHHEVTGSGPGLPLRDSQPRARPPAKHAVPSEVTAGRGLALKLSSGDEATARGAAVKESADEAQAAQARGAASLAAATTEAARRATGSSRRVDTQDETRDRAVPPDEDGAARDGKRGSGTTDAPRTATGMPGRAGDAPGGRSATMAHREDGTTASRAGASQARRGDESAQARVGREAEAEEAAGDDGAAVAEELPGAEEDGDELPGAPPDAEAVALRALAVAALLARASHEARPGNASEVRQLQSWVDAFGLFASFGAGAFELFDAPHGSWAAEDRAAVAWLAEELRLLLWALGREAHLPPAFERSDGKALAKQVPLLEPPHAFVAKATLRPLDEFERTRAFYDVLQEAAHCEAWARSLLDEPALADEEAEELEAILEAAEGPDFDRAAVEKKHGHAAAAVAGLRAWSRQLLGDLFAGGSPHAAHAFDASAFEAMDLQHLATALALAQTRARALEWLTEGDEWDLDEPGEDDEAAPEDEG